MDFESQIFDEGVSVMTHSNDYHDFKLLKTTANAKLYVAIKQGKKFLVKTTKDDTEVQLRMLRREYELSLGCDHAHVVHIFVYEPNLEVGPGIVMEYLECRSLSEYLMERPSLRERERIFGELLSAVGYMHRRGVIHNDLKPDNLLVTHADNSLKLIDFGLADNDAEIAMRNLGCTPHYASPELRERSGQVDARSDIYSVGVIMREMLGNSAIARRCVNVNPDRRFANVEALQRAWHHRHRSWRVACVAVLLVVLLLPTYFYIKEVRTSQSVIDNNNLHIAALQSDLDSVTTIYTEAIEAERKRVELRDKLIGEMEGEIKRAHEAIARDIRGVPYVEFVLPHLTKLWPKCDSIHKAYAARCEDVESSALLSSCYEQIYKRSYAEMADCISALPSYLTLSDKDERRYLDSLIKHSLPYKPYRSKAKKDK